MTIALQGFGPGGGIAVQGFTLGYFPPPTVPVFNNPSFEIPGPTEGMPDAWWVEDQALSFEPATFDQLAALTDHPNDLEHASWTAVLLVVTANAVASPAGIAAQAEQLQETGGAGVRQLVRATPIAFQAGKAYVFEAFLRYVTRTHAGLYLDATTDQIGVIADLSTQRITKVQVAAGGGNVDKVVARLTRYGNAWSRLRLLFRCVANFSGAPAIAMCGAGDSFASYTGLSRTINAWGAVARQLGPVHDAERFDGWVLGSLIETFTGLAAGFDNPIAGPGIDGPVEPFEDFEEYWSANEDSIEDFFSAAAAALFDVALVGEAFEDFEEGWLSNQDSYSEMPATAAASFDVALGAEAFEDFEEGWLSNQDALASFTITPGVTNPTFDLAEDFEDFEEVRFPVQVVPAPTLDTLTAIAHPFASNDRVTVEVENGTIAGGLYPGTVYWIIYVDANNVKLSATAGPGSAVDIQTSGSGTHWLRGDPLRYWTRLLL